MEEGTVRQHGQRIALGQRAQRLLRLLAVFGHAVEGRGELSDFVVRHDRNTVLQHALADGVRAGLHFQDRAHDPPGQKEYRRDPEPDADGGHGQDVDQRQLGRFLDSLRGGLLGCRDSDEHFVLDQPGQFHARAAQVREQALAFLRHGQGAPTLGYDFLKLYADAVEPGRRAAEGPVDAGSGGLQLGDAFADRAAQVRAGSRARGLQCEAHRRQVVAQAADFGSDEPPHRVFEALDCRGPFFEVGRRSRHVLQVVLKQTVFLLDQCDQAIGQVLYRGDPFNRPVLGGGLKSAAA